MASLPRRNVPPPMSTTASDSNNAVMPVTSPAFSLSTNNRSKSWGSLAGSLAVESFIVTLRRLLWVARPSLKPIVVTRRASNSSSWPDAHRCSQTVAGRLGSRPDFDSHIKEGFAPFLDQVFVPNRMVFEWPVEVQSTVFENLVPLFRPRSVRYRRIEFLS